MKPALIFDFGAVLVDWNPHYVFDDYFKDEEKCNFFLNTVCSPQWNSQMDGGRLFADCIAERIAEYPEWEEPLRLYHIGWYKMMGDDIPGMYDYLCELKSAGYPLYGLTNWSAETFPLVRDRKIFSVFDGILVSGQEKMLKPSPEIFHRLLEKFSLRAGACIFIDDNPANVQAAESLGIKALRFSSPENLRKELPAAIAQIVSRG